MMLGVVVSGCGWVCVCVFKLVCVYVCMFKTHNQRSVLQCVHIGGCVCYVV